MVQRSEVPTAYQSSGPPVTVAQLAYIHDLLDKKDLFASPQFFDAVNAMDAEEYAAYLARLKQQMGSITKVRASEILDVLTKLPDKPRESASTNKHGSYTTPAPSTLPAVDAGRYAVAMNHPNYDTPQIKFFRVDRPTEGRWAGYTFVKEFASDETYPVKGERVREVLAKIAIEPVEAMKRFGQEIGSCGRCGRTLTDPTSIKFGIGPVCRGEMGL